MVFVMAQPLWSTGHFQKSFDDQVSQQIGLKPSGLEDEDPKTESGHSPKTMQIHCKPGGLEDQDPKSEMSKIQFASWKLL